MHAHYGMQFARAVCSVSALIGVPGTKTLHTGAHGTYCTQHVHRVLHTALAVYTANELIGAPVAHDTV